MVEYCTVCHCELPEITFSDRLDMAMGLREAFPDDWMAEAHTVLLCNDCFEKTDGICDCGECHVDI